MKLPCPYCHATGKFRHERPKNVSDRWWLNMVGTEMKCPLCKGAGHIERAADALVVDTGLLFLKNLDRRVLVGCPDPGCVKWVDATEAFSSRGMSAQVGGPKVAHAYKPQADFQLKCPLGHDVVLSVGPTVNKWNRPS